MTEHTNYTYRLFDG